MHLAGRQGRWRVHRERSAIGTLLRGKRSLVARQCARHSDDIVV
jgi:hypothetical protein